MGVSWAPDFVFVVMKLLTLSVLLQTEVNGKDPVSRPDIKRKSFH